MGSKDIVAELLEEEWRRRRQKVVETGRIEAEDVMLLSIVQLNREVQEIMAKMATKEDIKNMATKDDIIKLRSELKTLKWTVGIGFTVIGVLVTLAQTLITVIR